MKINESYSAFNPNFKSIFATKNAKELLRKRLKQEELEKFHRLIMEQTHNKKNVFLDVVENGKKKVLTGRVYSSPNEYCEDFFYKELSPLVFIEKLCKFANDLPKVGLEDLLKMI